MAVGRHGLRWGGVEWTSVGQAETFSEDWDLGQAAVTRDTDSSSILVLASPGERNGTSLLLHFLWALP